MQELADQHAEEPKQVAPLSARHPYRSSSERDRGSPTLTEIPAQRPPRLNAHFS
jgi:hypothetical protein